MDPVSAFGLLASIENLAEGAFKLLSLVNTIQDGGKQRLRLLTEVNFLWMVLKLLDWHFESQEEDTSDSWIKTIAVLDEDEGVFDQISAALKNLMGRLQPKTGLRKFAADASLAIR
ncbi:hypothetical protein P7C71_g2613, partial [Lecanoromycetidae sp. Uapishka_2]